MVLTIFLAFAALCLGAMCGYLFTKGQAGQALGSAAALQTQLDELRVGIGDKDRALAAAREENARQEVRLTTLQDLATQNAAERDALKASLAKAQTDKFELQQQSAQLDIELKHQTSLCKAETGKLNEQIDLYKKLEAAHQERNQSFATLQGKYDGLAHELQKLQEQQNKVFEEWQEKVRAQFQVLSNNLFEEKSKALKEDSKGTVAELLAPVQEQFKAFADKVEQLSLRGTEQHGNIAQQLQQLALNSSQLSDDTNALTEALRGKSQTTGLWGEVVLEGILVDYGLKKNIHYKHQEFLKDINEDGEEKRDLKTDFTLVLPNGEEIIIDSKVTLKSYSDYIQATDIVEKDGYKKAMFESVRQHITTLKKKAYHGRKDGSIQLTFMFLPVEGLYYELINTNHALIEEAYNGRVVLVSPNSLMTTLTVIKDLWQRDTLQKEHGEIVKLAQRIHDKLHDSIVDFNSIATQVAKLDTTVRTAVDRLYDGAGSIIKSTREIRRIADKGAKPTKNLDQVIDKSKLVDNDFEDVTIMEDVEKTHLTSESISS